MSEWGFFLYMRINQNFDTKHNVSGETECER